MTASTTHCLPRPESALEGVIASTPHSFCPPHPRGLGGLGPKRRWAAGKSLPYRLLLLALALFALTASARADGIQVKAAALDLVDEVYQLNAEFDITLGSKLEEALAKGVPLFFEVEFQMLRPRWYWFDEEIADVRQLYRLSYNALTRQYELSMGGIHKNFVTFAEAKEALSQIRQWQVLDRSLVRRHGAYEAGLRMRLDVSQLPKPLQVNALASKDWNLDSDWRRWTFTP